MTSQDSTQAGGFVAGVMRRVENYADWHACHAAEFGYQGNEGVPNFKGTPEIASGRAALVAHLTTHASQQAAVVAGLVGALELMMEGSRRSETFGGTKVWGSIRMPRESALDAAEAALSAYHAMKEQP